MVTVIGVRFKKTGKIYYFDPGDIKIQSGDFVIVETIRGIEYGECVIGCKEVSEQEIVAPLKKVIRKANDDDTNRYNSNQKKEEQAFKICVEKIKKHNLVMKLIDVEYTFDNNKIIFYFTADGRVDFRELVKDLASVFRTRIELRQIGVRDEAKMIGGLGPCGRPMCCSTFLRDFAPVSIKMAKEQNLSLNPSKISGICGRLMCCLNYEQKAYEEIRRELPKVGSIVETPEGTGEVVDNSVIKRLVKVKLKTEDGEEVIKPIPICKAKLISGSFEGNIDENDIKIEVDNEELDEKTLKDLFKDN